MDTDITPEITIKEEILEFPDSEFLDALCSASVDDQDAMLDIKPPQPPEIGSRNSAFQPYKPLTILTNLQRGNVKTHCKDTPPPHPLSFQERAAKGSLTECEINESNVNSMDSSGLTGMMWGAFHGKLEMLELFVKKGGDVNASGPDGQTALMYAAAKGHLEVMRYLISVGADVEGEDDFGNTALMHAANVNQIASVNELLNQGASFSKTNFIGDNAFEIAYQRGNRAAQYSIELHLKKLLESSSTAD
jgi:ankyrin repeat protein